jgi:hypothetical protein
MHIMKKVKVIFSVAAFALAIAGALSTQANTKKRAIGIAFEQIGSSCIIRQCSNVDHGRGFCTFNLGNLRRSRIDFSTCGWAFESQFIYFP